MLSCPHSCRSHLPASSCCPVVHLHKLPEQLVHLFSDHFQQTKAIHSKNKKVIKAIFRREHCADGTNIPLHNRNCRSKLLQTPVMHKGLLKKSRPGNSHVSDGQNGFTMSTAPPLRLFVSNCCEYRLFARKRWERWNARARQASGVSYDHIAPQNIGIESQQNKQK